jgi:hypothetical protein
MPIPVVCPNGHHMSVPDRQAGKSYRCPLCWTHFPVPARGSTPPGEAVEKAKGPAPADGAPPPAPGRSPAAPAQPPAREAPAAGLPDAGASAGRKPVRIGLVLFALRWATLLLSALALLAQVTAIWITRFEYVSWRAATGANLDTPLIRTLQLLTERIGLLAPIFGLIGSALCLAGPAVARARRFLAAALLLDLANATFHYLILAEHVSSDPLLLHWLGGGSFLLSLGAWAFFLLYLQRLAVSLGAEEAAGEARGLLKKLPYLLLPPAGLGVVIWLEDDLSWAAVPLLCFLLPALLLILIALFWWQFTLIDDLRRLIAERN